MRKKVNEAGGQCGLMMGTKFSMGTGEIERSRDSLSRYLRPASSSHYPKSFPSCSFAPRCSSRRGVCLAE